MSYFIYTDLISSMLDPTLLNFWVRRIYSLKSWVVLTQIPPCP